VFSQQFLVDAWFVVKTFCVGLGSQTHKVLIAFVILCEEYQVMVSFLARPTRRLVLPAATSNVSFASDDRINTAVLHRVVKRNGAKHVAVISHCTGLHSKFFNSGRKWLDLNRAIKKAVVSMKVEVYELTVLHYSYLTGFCHVCREDKTKI